MFNFITKLFSRKPAASVQSFDSLPSSSNNGPRLITLPDGRSFDQNLDSERLSSQMDRVIEAVSDGQYHDLNSLVAKCGGTTASISARLRDLRKPKFGGHTVTSTRVGDPRSGKWVYKVTFKNS